MDLKNRIIESAYKIGFNQCRIGSLEPMDEAFDHLKNWLKLGLSAKMEYLQKSPELRTNPHFLFPKAKSVILLSANYYTKPDIRPDGFWGKIANYATGLDYHKVLPVKVNMFMAELSSFIPQLTTFNCVTDATPLYEIPLSLRHGMGFKGKNSLIIAPKLNGSFNFLVEVFCDLELEPDLSYSGTCGKCFRCGDICPTQAIVENFGIDANKCISYLTIENKLDIPVPLRQQIKNWVFGCDLCQDICPYNQKELPTTFAEFKPESGIGHYLNLDMVLNLKSNRQFNRLFGSTAISRARLKGTIRNSLVVMGNILNNLTDIEYINPDWNNLDNGLRLLNDHFLTQTDPMLLDHCAWAISQAHHGYEYLDKIYNLNITPIQKAVLKKYLT